MKVESIEVRTHNSNRLVTDLLLGKRIPEAVLTPLTPPAQALLSSRFVLLLISRFALLSTSTANNIATYSQGTFIDLVGRSDFIFPFTLLSKKWIRIDERNNWSLNFIFILFFYIYEDQNIERWQSKLDTINFPSFKDQFIHHAVATDYSIIFSLIFLNWTYRIMLIERYSLLA